MDRHDGARPGERRDDVVGGVEEVEPVAQQPPGEARQLRDRVAGRVLLDDLEVRRQRRQRVAVLGRGRRRGSRTARPRAGARSPRRGCGRRSRCRSPSACGRRSRCAAGARAHAASRAASATASAVAARRVVPAETARRARRSRGSQRLAEGVVLERPLDLPARAPRRRAAARRAPRRRRPRRARRPSTRRPASPQAMASSTRQAEALGERGVDEDLGGPVELAGRVARGVARRRGSCRGKGERAMRRWRPAVFQPAPPASTRSGRERRRPHIRSQATTSASTFLRGSSVPEIQDEGPARRIALARPLPRRGVVGRREERAVDAVAARRARGTRVSG